MSSRRTEKIYVVGHRGVVGSAIVRSLEKQGETSIVREPEIAVQELCAEMAATDLEESRKVVLLFRRGSVVSDWWCVIRANLIHVDSVVPILGNRGLTSTGLRPMPYVDLG